MYSTPIGLSALAAGRRGLDIVGQNLANAATPGYHRQGLKLVSQTAGGVYGTGVDVASVSRFDAPPVRTAIVRGNAEQGYVAARLDAQRQVEASLGTSPGTVGDALESFFNSVEQLTARPDSTALRRTVVAAAADVAGRLNTAAADVDRLRQDVGRNAKATVDEVNGFASQIASLNARIGSLEAGGTQANDLRDQRDQLVDQLSQRMEVQVVPQAFGVVNVISPGAAVVVGEYANTFAVNPDATGNLVVTQSGDPAPLPALSGTLGGQIEVYNQHLPAVRARLDGVARQLIARVNAVQATGLGAGGPMAAAAGTVSVADPTAPLAGQNLAIPARAGQLTVSVTAPDGTRTNAPVNIDPAAQSLNDVAAAITAATGPGVQAAVDPTSKTLKFTTQAGYTFDFAGRAPTSPAGAPAVADPDTAGLLPALGINGLYQGGDAATVAVRPEVKADPGLLAASRSGLPADTTNLERLAAVRDQPAVGTRTLSAEFADLAATVGADVSQLGDRQTAQDALLKNLSGLEQSVAGVDVNEELVHLLDYQRMIEAGSRYLSVVNSSMDEIMRMIQ